MRRQIARAWADKVALKSVGQGLFLSLFLTVLKRIELDASGDRVSPELVLYLAVAPTVFCAAANTITFFTDGNYRVEMEREDELEEQPLTENRI